MAINRLETSGFHIQERSHMRKQFTLRLFAAAAIFVSLLSVQTTNAQQSTNNTAASKATAAPFTVATGHAVSAVAEEDEKAHSAKPGGEGIKVHGHWVLEVKNPDGKLVERREFNNSLVSGGASISGDQILAALLSGNATPGGLSIAFISGPANTTGIDNTTFCNDSAVNPNSPPQGTGIQCFGLIGSINDAVRVTGIQFSFTYQIGLQRTVSFSPGVNIVLSGNFTVLPSYGITSISAVQTYASFCLPAAAGFPLFNSRPTGSTSSSLVADIAPKACNFSIITSNSDDVDTGALTSTVIPNGPLAVAPNQIITVTVTLSFS
jgi:hypothetical protein